MAALWDRLQREAVEIHVAAHLRARLERGDRLRVKLGLDPTAPDLHVGHLVVLDVLRAFQDAGHTVVVIIGDYTALIGDPSGRSETRPMLTREQVDANAETYFKQLYLVLDRERTEVHGNAEWLAEMSAADILRLLGKATLQQVLQREDSAGRSPRAADILRLLGKATLQQVLQREDFAQRIREGSPIGAHELLYPFNQAYDSVAVQADVEIGGTDQLFNLLFGREIQKAYGQEPQDIAVFPLLEGTDGVKKMSKSLDNYIGLTEAPEEVYGKVMSMPDSIIPTYMQLLLGIEKGRYPSAHNRDNKAYIAARLVERLHGGEAAARSEEDFDRRFRRRETPDEVEEKRITSPDPVAALVELGLARTRGEARRLVEQGGLRVDGEKVGLDFRLRDGQVVRAGKKKNFVRVRYG